MSSIYGRLNFDTCHKVHDQLRLMKKALNHWPADRTGEWEAGAVALGHLMLYNTPESFAEPLPFYNRLAGLTITADARIDNRNELIAKLDIRIAKKAITDSLLILKCYEKYGEDCMHYFIGDFAFAIWDEKENKLFCAVDQIGIKPLYYYSDSRFFAFASEKKGLLANDDIKSPLDEDYLMRIVGDIPTHKHRTAFRNIYRLNPGHFLIVKDGTVTVRKYWEIAIGEPIRYRDEREYLEAFNEKFALAVNDRLRSDFLVASELSGGLDSSGITAVAARLLHQQGKQLASISLVGTKNTAIYENHEERDNEFVDAVIAMAQMDRPIKIYSGGYTNWREQIDLALETFDGPEFSTIYWSFPIKKIAGEMGARTILSGFGGDHVVTNTNGRYYIDYLQSGALLKYFVEGLKKQSFSALARELIATKAGKWLLPFRERRQLSRIDRAIASSRRNYLKGVKISPELSWQPLLPATFAEIQLKRVLMMQNSIRCESENILAKRYRAEIRFPMADIRLIDFVLRIPATIKAQAGADRYLFRKAMEGFLPDQIIHEHDYTGYSNPVAVSEWLASQAERRQHLQAMQTKGYVPDYVDFEKLLKNYKFDANTKRLNSLDKVVEIETLLNYLIKPHEREPITC